MYLLIASLLAVALAVSLLQIYRQRQATRRLHQAILDRTPLLNEETASDESTWSTLCQGVNGLIEEIARLHQARSGQLAQLQATLGSLQEAVLIVDRDNYILLANRALQKIFPRAKDILNHKVERVLHSAAFLTYVEKVRHNAAEPQKVIEFASEDNRAVWLEVTGTPVAAPVGQKGPWVLFVLHDITELKKLEMVRKEFVANVSHELRTPLSVIKGYVETLVDGHHTMGEGDRDKFLRTIQRHTERLNSLLEDLLTLSRLESINPGLRRESSDLGALLQNVIDDFNARPGSAEHQLALTVSPGIPSILIDPLKITQVLENLLENAVKYTPKGSRVEVTARLDDRDVEVAVADNGPGIPPEDIPHIFERFYRVDKGRSREKGGTGLGLSIVKHIVHLHQGRVWVESALEKGTTFRFRVPVGVASPPAQPIATTSP
jgi:two-component system, OmpR family, phosphate regulon sensor histidine kinase PhoR